jgi:hypothetical protein
LISRSGQGRGHLLDVRAPCVLFDGLLPEFDELGIRSENAPNRLKRKGVPTKKPRRGVSARTIEDVAVVQLCAPAARDDAHGPLRTISAAALARRPPLVGVESENAHPSN